MSKREWSHCGAISVVRGNSKLDLLLKDHDSADDGIGRRRHLPHQLAHEDLRDIGGLLIRALNLGDVDKPLQAANMHPEVVNFLHH